MTTMTFFEGLVKNSKNIDLWSILSAIIGILVVRLMPYKHFSHAFWVTFGCAVIFLALTLCISTLHLTRPIIIPVSTLYTSFCGGYTAHLIGMLKNSDCAEMIMPGLGIVHIALGTLVFLAYMLTKNDIERTWKEFYLLYFLNYYLVFIVLL